MFMTLEPQPIGPYSLTAQRPALIRPYMADSIRITSFGRHCASNTSKLQYSRSAQNNSPINNKKVC